MHSNQPVKTPRSKSGVQLTGQEIQALLNDPHSPLSKDLKNAIKNSILAKKALKKAEDQYTDEKILELKIEDFENELARERKSSYDKYIAAFENYYEQIKLAVREAQISGSSNINQTSHYHTLLHLFAIFTKALAVVENEIVELHNERKILLQNYADAQKACGVAFDAMYNNPTYLDMSKIPLDEQAAVIDALQNARDVVTQPKTQEERMKSIPLDDPLRKNFEIYGPPPGEFFKQGIKDQLAMVFLHRTVARSTGRDDSVRTATIESEYGLKRLSPHKNNFTIINGKLHLNTRNTLAMESKRTLLQIDGIYLAEELEHHRHIEHYPKSVAEFKKIHRVLLQSNKDKQLTATMQNNNSPSF